MKVKTHVKAGGTLGVNIRGGMRDHTETATGGH
jgi:hypothetical protein